MTNLDRNTRTLIVCFTLALMGLLPLRFVEAGQKMVMERPMVLGETVSKKNLETRNSGALEKPFDEIERMTCISEDEAGRLVDEMTRVLISGDYSEAELMEMVDAVEKIEKRICGR